MTGPTPQQIRAAVKVALAEDLALGDVTTRAIFPAWLPARATIVAHEPLTLAGVAVARQVFTEVDASLKVVRSLPDGATARSGSIVMVIEGDGRSLLAAERAALNFLQHLSGIATLTSRFCAAVKGYRTRILDTRKTTPNLRMLEKYAVTKGGGMNHRMGLYDQVLIKDNHLDFVDLKKAMRDLRQFLPHSIKIEIEVDTPEVLERAISANPDIIMLDNMGLDSIEKSIAMIRESRCRAKIEVSGGVNLRNVGDIARLKPDFISIGYITHSPEALDISLKFVK